MITDLKISGFRRFRRLTMRGLGRINLIVGKNNSGKSAVLEAVDCVLSDGTDLTWLRGPYTRGEYRPAGTMGRPGVGARSSVESWVGVSGLFHDFGIHLGSRFEIEATTDRPWMGRNEPVRFEAKIVLMDPHRESVVTAPSAISSALNPKGLALTFPGDDPESAGTVENLYGRDGGELRVDFEDCRLRWESVGRDPAVTVDSLKEGWSFERFGPRTYLGAESIAETRVLHHLWRRAYADGSTDWVLQLLRLVEPTLARLLPGADPLAPWGTSFEIGLEGRAGLLPLGTLGEGARRLLGIALALVTARSGVLLVDEIEIGLHHSVMTRVWKMVSAAVRSLDVQVFATTHSLDCWRALARVCDEEPELVGPMVSVHRLDAGLEESIRYSAAELTQAAESDFEIR